MDDVAKIRAFNRRWTARIGLLAEGLDGTDLTLAEARVLYELAHTPDATSGGIARTLSLDVGYLSRILSRFQRSGWIARRPSPSDRRTSLLALTDEGSAAFSRLDAATRAAVGGLLDAMPSDTRRRVVDALADATEALSDPAPIELREPGPGDLGWVVERHGAVYWQEHRWGVAFEGLVAGIVADFARDRDPTRERAWIAWRGDRRVGSVFLVRHPERTDTARLRLLLVEPSARGTGLGRRLVRECTRFAAQAGYRRITLWTNDVLRAARRIYESEGYLLVREAPHAMFGEGLVGQDWERSVP